MIAWHTLIPVIGVQEPFDVTPYASLHYLENKGWTATLPMTTMTMKETVMVEVALTVGGNGGSRGGSGCKQTGQLKRNNQRTLQTHSMIFRTQRLLWEDRKSSTYFSFRVQILKYTHTLKKQKGGKKKTFQEIEEEEKEWNRQKVNERISGRARYDKLDWDTVQS